MGLAFSEYLNEKKFINPGFCLSRASTVFLFLEMIPSNGNPFNMISFSYPVSIQSSTSLLKSEEGVML